MQRHKRLDQALNEIEESLEEVEYALRDGYQPHDECIVARAVVVIRAHSLTIEDVSADIDAARRALVVGRNAVYDGRFVARDRRLREVKAQYVAVLRQKRNGSRTVEVQRSR